MTSDDAVWALFSSGRVDVDQIDIQPDAQIKSILGMLRAKNGYIYSPNYKDDRERRYVRSCGHYLQAGPIEISTELERK
jgi:hypothetical protein